MPTSQPLVQLNTARPALHSAPVPKAMHRRSPRCEAVQRPPQGAWQFQMPQRTSPRHVWPLAPTQPQGGPTTRVPDARQPAPPQTAAPGSPCLGFQACARSSLSSRQRHGTASTHPLQNRARSTAPEKPASAGRLEVLIG